MTAAAARDGRHRRGEDNRARIVAAMLEIVQGGDVSPSAEQVATRADVGLRTVFRHFKDMDSLYREMSVVVEREMRAIIEQPLAARDWRERLVELIGRRATVFEKIAPFKRAANVARHRSKFLEADNARLATALREILEAQLPPHVAGDASKVEILDLLLSFESWSRLRHEQGLSVARARETLEAAIRQLVA
jgi:AcrR family transcriptional regulator